MPRKPFLHQRQRDPIQTRAAPLRGGHHPQDAHLPQLWQQIVGRLMDGVATAHFSDGQSLLEKAFHRIEHGALFGGDRKIHGSYSSESPCCWAARWR